MNMNFQLKNDSVISTKSTVTKEWKRWKRI